METFLYYLVDPETGIHVPVNINNDDEIRVGFNGERDLLRKQGSNGAVSLFAHTSRTTRRPWIELVNYGELLCKKG